MDENTNTPEREKALDALVQALGDLSAAAFSAMDESAAMALCELIEKQGAKLRFEIELPNLDLRGFVIRGAGEVTFLRIAGGYGNLRFFRRDAVGKPS